MNYQLKGAATVFGLLVTIALSCTDARAVAVAKGCGDASVLGIGPPAVGIGIKATLALLSDSDQRVAIPINRPTTGDVSASAMANGEEDSHDPPNANILTPGTPPTVSAVSTRKVKADRLGADAEAIASIAGALQLDAQGGILGATAFTSSGCDADSFFGIASSAAIARTDPFVLAPLSESMTMRVDIDLSPNFQTDPNTAFGIHANADGALESAEASVSYSAITNIPGLETLFEFTVAATDSGPSDSLLTVSFNSSLISQPFSEADFNGSGEPGSWILDPNAAVFSLEFEVPAGVLGSDSQGTFGLALDVIHEGDALALAAIPEPSTIALVVLSGSMGLGGYCWRRRRVLPSR